MVVNWFFYDTIKYEIKTRYVKIPEKFGIWLVQGGHLNLTSDVRTLERLPFSRISGTSQQEMGQ